MRGFGSAQVGVLLPPLACCVTLGQHPDLSGASVYEMGTIIPARKMVIFLLCLP